jgi:ubiquinone/menaquinone biosynthesis C-methylase UbiE
MREHAFSIRRYFDGIAARFDSIYSAEKPLHQRIIDHAFRSTVNERYDLIMGELSNVAGKRILDVGTGSGRYAVELAARGATVVGADFSSKMLRLAREAAQQRGVAARCRWEEGDFLNLDLGDRYDVTLAIGFFDYVADPKPILERMMRLTKGMIYASFPKRWTVRTLPRKIRLTLNGCYVRFYTPREIEDLKRTLGPELVSLRLIPVKRDLIMAARIGNAG